MASKPEELEIDLRAWAEGDFDLLQRLLGDPLMTEHLGGPESLEKLRERHERYLQHGKPLIGEMFVIVAGSDRASAGSIGYWEREWQGHRVWESGWSVLPEFQGRGVATRALLLTLDRALAAGRNQYVHAFPSVDNPASNAICRKAGFAFQGACDFEYPKGHWMRCNDWRIGPLGA